MLFRFYLTISLLASIPTLAQTPNAASSGRRYFGLHFDFHAETGDSSVGRNLSERSMDSLLSAVKPDFIQIDCKGLFGIASYPSKLANATTVRPIYSDALRFYRAVTKKHGVDLYLHYSGLQDYAVLKKHPDWSVIRADGTRDDSHPSMHSPYADSLVIPQLNEVADYGATGMWVDGDCFNAQLEYSPAALAAFRAETGIQAVPKSNKEPYYQQFRDFSRQSFRRYLAHYLDEVHRHNPAFRLASNWAYSSMMPEPILANVDFLSGDLQPMNSVNAATFEARILASQGRMFNKPWDLQSWSFWYGFGEPAVVGDQKTAVHLMQEAAEIIAVGGGFQGYFFENRDASISLSELPVMVALSKFIRARQPFCQNTAPVPQIALLLSNATMKKFDQRLYSRDQAYRVQGMLTVLLDSRLSVEVLAEHHLMGRMAQYPAIVISQQDSLAPAFRRELLDYARQGGNLVLIGVETTKLFASELGIAPDGPATSTTKWVHFGGKTAALNGLFQPVRITGAAKPFGQMTRSEYGAPSDNIATTTTEFGKGKLVGVYADLSRDYEKHQSPKARDLVASLVRPLLPNPVATVSGSHLVHLVVNRLGGKLAVNLINTGGRHADPQVFTYDEVPPLSNLSVTIHTAKKPARIVQQPENKSLPFTFANGTATLTVPTLTVHSILMVE